MLWVKESCTMSVCDEIWLCSVLGFFVTVMNHHDQKQISEKGFILFGSHFHSTVHWRKLQGRKLEAGADAVGMKGCYLLACFFLMACSASFLVLPIVGLALSHQSSVGKMPRQTRLQVSFAETFSQMSLFQNDSRLCWVDIKLTRLATIVWNGVPEMLGDLVRKTQPWVKRTWYLTQCRDWRKINFHAIVNNDKTHLA